VPRRWHRLTLISLKLCLKAAPSSPANWVKLRSPLDLGFSFLGPETLSLTAAVVTFSNLRLSSFSAVFADLRGVQFLFAVSLN